MKGAISFSVAMLLSFGLLGTAYGQNNYDELFNLSYDYYAPATLDKSGAELTQFKCGVEGGYGFTLNEQEDRLNIGGGYEFLQLKNNLEPQAPLNIHASAIMVEYQKNWKNPRWGSTFSSGLALISDYKTSAYTAYQTSMNAMFHYGKNYDLIWTFGLTYSDQPFGPWLFPVLGVDWRISDRLYFQTVLFSKIYLEYEVKYYKLYVGLDIEENGQSFVISDYQNQQDSYITSFSERFPYYPFDNTLFVDYYLKKGWVIYAKAGVQVSQAYKHFTVENNEFEQSLYHSTVAPSFTGKVGIAYRFRK